MYHYACKGTHFSRSVYTKAEYFHNLLLEGYNDLLSF